MDSGFEPDRPPEKSVFLERRLLARPKEQPTLWRRGIAAKRHKKHKTEELE
jgi:hypothetical protein